MNSIFAIVTLFFIFLVANFAGGPLFGTAVTVFVAGVSLAVRVYANRAESEGE